jgi:hypothetical protein
MDRNENLHYKKEYDSLQTKNKQLQIQLRQETRKRDELETELRFVVTQMDKEKAKSIEKISRLKAALMD